jgi:flagellar protein FlbD
MIRLTRLNNSALAVNSDLIKFVEQAPDTVITLVNGEKIIVRETADEVLNRIVDFRRSVLQGIFPAWDHIALVSPAANSEEAEPNEQAER